MKNKKMNLIILTVFLISLASAQVVVEQQPSQIYNLNEKIELELTITPENSNLISLYLECENQKIEVYKEYLFIENEITKEITIPLLKNFIQDAKGECYISHSTNTTQTKISNLFKISDKIQIESNNIIDEIEPGQTITLTGIAKRESGKTFNGEMEAIINTEQGEIKKTGEIQNGDFSLEITIPNDMKPGKNTIQIKAYETNQNTINQGYATPEIKIKQMPNNLEILLEKTEINPEEEIAGKIILHDQIGENIQTKAYIAIKNENDQIIKKIEQQTGSEFKYKIEHNTTPGKWKISAYSEELTNIQEIKINKLEKISINIVNSTLIISNEGNVIYNKTQNIKIGNQEVPLDINLNVDETEKYLLSAPNGEYEIKFQDFSKKIALTGNAINIEKISKSNKIFKSSTFWTALILLLGFIVITLFKKNNKKKFFGRILSKEKTKPEIQNNKKEENIITPSIKTKLSLSIVGKKQDASIGCLLLKNYDEILNGEGNIRETMQEISKTIEKEKGLIHTSNEHIFFILAPERTKTFSNKENAIALSEKIKKILNQHNKKFKIKINYGIGLNHGPIIIKDNKNTVEFMSMGTLIILTKKMARHSNAEILMSESFKKELDRKIVAEKKEIGNSIGFLYKEMKNTNHSNFIKSFVDRQQRERITKENQKD